MRAPCLRMRAACSRAWRAAISKECSSGGPMCMAKHITPHLGKLLGLYLFDGAVEALARLTGDAVY
jgi:hypothetical protein